MAYINSDSIRIYGVSSDQAARSHKQRSHLVGVRPG